MKKWGTRVGLFVLPWLVMALIVSRPAQAQDLTTLLSNFLVTLRSGILTATTGVCLDQTNQDACLQRQASGVFNMTAGSAGTTFARLNFGTAIAGNPSLKASGTALLVRLADDSSYGNIQANAFTLTAANNSAGYVYASANKLARVTDNGDTTGVEISLGSATLGTCTAGTITTGSHNFAGGYTGNTSGSCVINFGTPNWTNTPFCVAMSIASTTHPRVSAVSTSAMTITGGVSGEAITYHCDGRIGT